MSNIMSMYHSMDEFTQKLCVYLLLCVQICCQLLKKSPDKRLGSSERDAEDIKRQAFFRVSSCFCMLH